MTTDAAGVPELQPAYLAMERVPQGAASVLITDNRLEEIMLMTNWHHIAAPIEAPESYDTDAAVEYATQILIDRYQADEWRVSEAITEIETADWSRVEKAVMAHDDLEAGRAMREAVARVIRAQAAKDAAKDYRRILRDEMED